MGCIICWLVSLLFGLLKSPFFWGIYLVFCFFMLRLVHGYVNKKLLYLKKMDVNQMAQVPGSARYDFSSIKIWQLYLGSITLFPIRFLLSNSLMCFIFVLVWIPKTIFGGKYLFMA